MKRRYTRTNRRSSYYARRRKRNFLPFLLFVGVLALFFWAILQFFSLLFSGVRTEIKTAELAIEKGRVDFRLSQTGSPWTPAFSGQTFVEGDKLQTAKNSKGVLTFLSNSKIFIDQSTTLDIENFEKNVSGKNQAIFTLNDGQIWGNIQASDFAEKDSVLTVQTQHLSLHIYGTIFNLETSDAQTTVRLMRGQASAEILENGTIVKTIPMGVGQELVLNSKNLQTIKNGANALSVIDPRFLQSDWHIQNLEIFDPETAQALKEQVVANNPPEPEKETPKDSANDDSEIDAADADPSVTPPLITAPADGDRVQANPENSITIKGTAPLEAFQIQVNDYTLSKFQPGDRKWSYFAATKFDTLKPGENTYSVVTITREGLKSTPTKINLFYEGILEKTTLPPEETTSIETNDNQFPSPTVTRPAIFKESPDATYQTSASVVTFAGKVPLGTNGVEVNGFRLRKFQVGDTDFSYIANANYGNMREGENVYTIVALGPDGKSSQTQIKIVYTPVKIDA